MPFETSLSIPTDFIDTSLLMQGYSILFGLVFYCLTAKYSCIYVTKAKRDFANNFLLFLEKYLHKWLGFRHFKLGSDWALMPGQY